MIRFEHSLFALPFAYLGLIFAEQGLPDPKLLFWVTLAMVGFRSAAMSLNRIIDRHLDACNPRTRNRALPAGRLSTSAAYVWTIGSLMFYFLAAFRLNAVCFVLSPLPLLVAWVYPWLKRFTWLSHWVLGAILGMAPVGAWLAVRPEFSWSALLLGVGVMVWVAGFDILYAFQDVDFDREKGLKSFPVRFGIERSLRWTQGLHWAAVAFWLLAGYRAGLGPVYGAGIIAASLFLLRENRLMRLYGTEKIQEAFFNMNAMVSAIVFLSAAADFVLKGGGG